MKGLWMMMEKINCDIIRDLLPSYVDGICSESTRQCIEEHIENCQDCKENIRILKETEISAIKLEQQQINFAKKINKNIQNKGIIDSILLLAFMLLSVLVIEYQNRYNQWNYSMIGNIYLITLPIFMLLTYILTLYQTKRIKIQKSDMILNIVSVLLDLYAAFLIYYGFRCTFHEKSFFGIELSQIGLVIHRQFIIAILIQFIIFIWNLLKVVKKGFISSIFLNLNLTGVFFILSLHLWLSRLGSPYFESTLIETTKKIFVIGIVGMVIFYFIDKRRQKK